MRLNEHSPAGNWLELQREAAVAAKRAETELDLVINGRVFASVAKAPNLAGVYIKLFGGEHTIDQAAQVARWILWVLIPPPMASAVARIHRRSPTVIGQAGPWDWCPMDCEECAMTDLDAMTRGAP